MQLPAQPAVYVELRRLHREGGAPVDTGGSEDWYEVMLFPPAREEQIEAAVSAVGGRVPRELLQFWRFTDGANLFVNESGLHGVGVSSTELITGLQEEEREFYGEEALRDYLVFARVNGAGTFLAFDLNTGRVLDGVHAEQPHEWRTLAENLHAWLAEFVESGGRYYWIEALYGSAPSGAH